MAKAIITKLLNRAGIDINGTSPWDIQVHDERFFGKVLRQGSLGLGESYMDGWWDSTHLDQFFERLLRRGVPAVSLLNLQELSWWLKSRLVNLATEEKSVAVAKRHYDLGNDLYAAMLDPSLAYSCGYWKSLSWDSKCLAAAQSAKYNLICRKLGIKAGQKILDIGCGWGGFARFAAANYQVQVVGITISKEQAIGAKEKCQGQPVEILSLDYRKLRHELGPSVHFDHVVSVGMFEHVEPKNYREFMEIAHALLKPEGLFLLHTIGGHGFVPGHDPWMRKYIFPVAQLPRRPQIHRSVEDLFRCRDWHEFGKYYDPTLMAWYERFTQAWPQLKSRYEDREGGRFFRMWQYYLLCCAGAFRSGNLELWQIVYSHPEYHDNYHWIR
ncbi:MAG TPA: cyclopropane fatty acyl phospholipid synthase [Methylomirabilota bacterium]|nr:cyclopropane fatty acyl phospholipid synthase [Methylomirabilota bacterium]